MTKITTIAMAAVDQIINRPNLAAASTAASFDLISFAFYDMARAHSEVLPRCGKG
jgi:hypothetical protein